MVVNLPSTPNLLKNMNFWQTEDFSWTGATSPKFVPSHFNFISKVLSSRIVLHSSSIGVVDQKDLLSTSVPAALVSGSQISPLSDYLSDISGTTTGPARSPSHAGPQRNSSTLHKLLMKKETMRPLPSSRSPDSRKTYDRMRMRLVYLSCTLTRNYFSEAKFC
jgi:hypothetical protein